MMGEGLIGIEYCCTNRSCSINAPQDLIKLMTDKFVGIIEANLKVCKRGNWLSDLKEEEKKEDDNPPLGEFLRQAEIKAILESLRYA